MGVEDEVTFTGGVSRNEAMVQALEAAIDDLESVLRVPSMVIPTMLKIFLKCSVMPLIATRWSLRRVWARIWMSTAMPPLLM